MSDPAPDLPRLFLACAPPDLKYAELIIAKARHERLPLTFDSFMEGRSTDPVWQLECRRRIRAARALIAIVSARTRASPRAVWQVECARKAGVPVIGVSVAFEGDPALGPAAPLDPDALLTWRWKTIASMMMRVAQADVAAAKTGAPRP